MVGWFGWLAGGRGGCVWWHSVGIACISRRKRNMQKKRKNTEAVRRLIKCRSVVSQVQRIGGTSPASFPSRSALYSAVVVLCQVEVVVVRGLVHAAAVGRQATVNVGLRGYGVQNRDCQPTIIVTSRYIISNQCDTSSALVWLCSCMQTAAPVHRQLWLEHLGLGIVCSLIQTA